MKKIVKSSIFCKKQVNFWGSYLLDHKLLTVNRHLIVHRQIYNMLIIIKLYFKHQNPYNSKVFSQHSKSVKTDPSNFTDSITATAASAWFYTTQETNSFVFLRKQSDMLIQTFNISADMTFSPHSSYNQRASWKFPFAVSFPMNRKQFIFSVYWSRSTDTWTWIRFHNCQQTAYDRHHTHHQAWFHGSSWSRGFDGIHQGNHQASER